MQASTAAAISAALLSSCPLSPTASAQVIGGRADHEAIDFGAALDSWGQADPADHVPAIDSTILPASHGTGEGTSCGVAVDCGCSAMGCGCGVAPPPTSILARPQLLGDMLGLRPGLAKHGILYEASLTQFYQGVASGGSEQVFRYGGKLDQYFIFDSAGLGLWKGGKLIMHADTGYGQNSILDAAGMAPANTAALFPRPNDLPVISITHFQFEQELPGGYAVTAGKFNFLDLWEQFYPDYGKGLDGFMNVSSIIFLDIIPTLPTVFNGGGIVKAGEKGVEAAVMAVDTNTTATVSGVSDLFDNGISVLAVGRVFTEFGGLPGSHLIGGTWSSKEYTSFERTGWSFHPGHRITIPTKSDSWFGAYVGEQTLWIDPGDEQRKAWFLTTWGISDQETSPYGWGGTASIEAIGFNSSRVGDRMGVSYFYSGVSKDLRNLVSPAIGLQDLQGGELYYNAEITPWFHLTADLQVIQTEIDSQDGAVVVGLRAKMDL